MSIRLTITDDDDTVMERISVVCLKGENVATARRIVDLVFNRYDCYEEGMTPDNTPRKGP